MADLLDQVHAQIQQQPQGDLLDQVHLEATSPAKNVLDDPGNKYVGESNGIPVYKAKDVGEQLADIPKGVWENFVQSGHGLINAVAHPIDTVKGIGAAQDAVRQKMAQSAKDGDYVTAARHLVNYLIPMLGPGLDESGDLAQKGEWGRATGQTIGTAIQMAAPEVLRAVAPQIPLSPRVGPQSRLNPIEAQNQAWLDQKGIDTSLSMQTGSKTARNLEGSVQNDIGGAGYAADAREATRQQIQGQAQQELDQIYPQPVTPGEAGGAVLGKFKADIRQLDADANTSYKSAYRVERDPRNVKQVPKQVRTQNGWEEVVDPNTNQPVMEDMQLPVDMRPMKMALGPVARQYARTLSDTQAHASLGLKTMRDIIAGPDYKSLSQAEMDLGLLKKAAKQERGMAELRNESQGLAAYSVGQFQQDIDSTMATAHGGQQGLADLQAGRAATAKKWSIYEQTKKFGKPNIEDLEPMSVYNKLTGDKDIRDTFLKRIRAMAPAEMPKVGRALMQEIVDRVFRKGGINHEEQALNAWDAIGPEARKVFFRDPKLINDLNETMMALNRIAKEPNPSGSGYIIALNNLKKTITSGAGLVLGGGAGAVMGGAAGATEGAGLGLVTAGGLHVISNAALARMLFSPKWTALLRRGIQLQISGDKVGAGLAAAQMVKMAGKEARRIETQEQRQ